MGNGLFINGKKDGQVTFVKAENISDDSRTKENGKTWEFLLVAGPSPPQYGNPMYVRNLWFILHFMTLETFLVYTKKITIIGGYFGWSKITW